MSVDRKAAVDYARKYWNRAADDDKFWTSNAVVDLAQKRRSMNAPASDGWQAFFVGNGAGGENAVFRRTVDGRTEEMPEPIATWDQLDDCTHYVSRCLIAEGVKLTETPRANELTEAMIASNQTKVLAVKTSQSQGQKVVDSGLFKPGDMLGYYTERKGRYTHTAMFVGRLAGGAGDPGGITCHTVCRFEGLTQAWNGADDDAWFLHEGLSYTLIHFSDDDSPITQATLGWLPGWWKVGASFYFVTDTGRAFATSRAPRSASDKLFSGASSAHYFDDAGKITFVWNGLGGAVRLESWSSGPGGVVVSADGLPVSAAAVFA
jgi:hypothetical protein